MFDTGYPYTSRDEIEIINAWCDVRIDFIMHMIPCGWLDKVVDVLLAFCC